MRSKFEEIYKYLQENSVLIHCITNPISINDCANAVLALGAKPIMAEHPAEVAEITKTAKALAVNLGNITDARMKSILISGETAFENNIPSVIDVVGVACSSLRQEIAKEYIETAKPKVIKGNLTELKALIGLNVDAIGIDVGKNDVISDENLHENIKILSDYSNKTGSVILASGKVDLIVWQNKAYTISNGVQMLSQVTGTGCMLNVLVATLISSGLYPEAVILATALMGISGEMANSQKGTGTFRIELMDMLSTLKISDIMKKIKLKEITL